MAQFGQRHRRRLIILGLALLAVVATLVIRVEMRWTPSTAAAANTTAATQPGPPSKPLTTAQLIGIDRIDKRLGLRTPTGKGIVFGHVEGGPTNEYMPDSTSQRFHGMMMIPVSGESKSSGHAQTTALILYGEGGLAPGVNRVLCFSARHWMGPGCLHVGSDRPPAAGHIRVFTNSWVGGKAPDSDEMLRQMDNSFEVEALRRLDYLIDEDDVIVVAGVNNGRDSPMPALLASSYNLISVGNWDGNSSSGYTRFDGPGRCKPEVVAPQGLVSFATPVVAACVARLLEVTDRGGPHSPAGHAEVIKALLMAGADKPPEWKPEAGKPLDTRLGAGRVRFDRSYDILDAGEAVPGQLHNRYGWAFQPLARTSKHVYLFNSSRAMGEASIMLVWNRRVRPQTTQNMFTGEMRWIGIPRLADFDLRLIRLDDNGQPSELGVSAGRIDNVEHLYFKSLPRGRYRIEVTRKDDLDEDWDYALAFRIENTSAEQPR